MKFVVATKNPKKLAELQRILAPLGATVLSEKDLAAPLQEVVEDADSFRGNALLKARAAVKQTGCAAIADDSGLCVDYLNGAPGIFSARYAGAGHNDEANNQKLLKALNGVPLEKRTAHYTCAVAVVFANGQEFTVEGRCEGYIALAPQGNGGFGYDPLFCSPAGCFGQLTPEQKDAVSHRGKALRLMAAELKKYL